MICDRPVDHRVVFMTNDARVLHAGCVPDHVKVPIPVLLQAIRRLERMVDRAREGNSDESGNGSGNGDDSGGGDDLDSSTAEAQEPEEPRPGPGAPET
jgi:hypothetical protein